MTSAGAASTASMAARPSDGVAIVSGGLGR